jgi:hypothetical protein
MTLPHWLNDQTIIKLIKEHSVINKNNKEKNGEVCTPLELVCDLLEKMPIEIWKNPLLKWFDPANGNGNFLIVVYYKLMDELKFHNLYIEPSIRSKHIIENMLYMVELNPECIATCLGLFQRIDATATPNIVCADFLKAEDAQLWNDVFFYQKNKEVELFDIILGNPPYNIDGIKHKGKKNVYVFFALKGFDLLKKGGLLAYIHPPTYRIPHHKIQHTRMDLNHIYTNKRIICIKMFSIIKTKKMMNVMMNVDYIIVENTQNNHLYESTIIDVDEKEYKQLIRPNEFIPNYGLPILKKMKTKADAAGNLELILTSEMHAQLISGGTTYKNIHGIKKKGIKICYSKKPHSLQNKRKLIINGIGSYNYVFYDKHGEYGFTQSPIAVCEPSSNTLHLIQSKLFHYLADATKIIGNNFNIQTLLFLPLIIKPEIANENDLYDYFEFTNEERTEIEKSSIPIYQECELLVDD